MGKIGAMVGAGWAAAGLLLTVGTAGAAEPAADAVKLNHFFLVLDGETFRAIQQSGFMRREFAVTEERTTVREDLTYTGLYFYGIGTYFEFFDASSDSRWRQGNCGVAFSVDRPGGLKRLEERAAGPLPMAGGPVTRQYEGRAVPWFTMISPRELQEDAPLITWTMEYAGTFLSEWHAEVKTGGRGITRQEVLARYAAVLPGRPERPILRDVTGLTLAVTPAEQDVLVRQARVFGHQVRAEGAGTVIEVPGAWLRLEAATEGSHGVKAIRLRVENLPGSPREIRFGPRSRLVVNDDGTAEWNF